VSMALVMSTMPDVWRKVLAEHVPDGTQHCRECRNGGGQASWPCQTYRIAQEAKWVAEGNLPGTGPHGPGLSASPYMSPPEPQRREEPAPAYGAADPRRDAPWGAPTPSWAGGHPSTDSVPATGAWPGPSSGSYSLHDASQGSWTGAHPSNGTSSSTGGFRPLAGDPLGTPYPEPPTTNGRPGGEQPYGSTFDAPYGASFGVDDHPHAARY
jgi:hypothetical protein